MDLNRMVICLKDPVGAVLLKKKLTGLPLQDAVVVEKSIEWFNDPEPCMIHRSAVMKRLFFEWADYLADACSRGTSEVLWSDVPESLRRTVQIHGIVSRLSVEMG